MKSKVMGVDAANRRKNANIKVTASGGKNPGANWKPMSKPAPMGGAASGISSRRDSNSKMAPKSSPRPYTRTDKEISDMADHSIKQGVKYQKSGGKVTKMAMGGKVSEYGGKENYKSKASMMKHEGMESKAVEKMESKMAGGGMCRGMGAAKKGGSYKG